VKRGEIWSAAGGKGYTSKPRPVVIVQDDRFAATGSVTVCPFTSDPTDAPLLRLVIEPTKTNSLRTTSRLMVDKLTTMSRQQVSDRVGRLDEADMLRLNRAMLVFLGIAG
jgi:mRNA interferase MazF